MAICSKKKWVSGKVNDRVARALAELVLKVQARLAAACAKRFNTYSRRKKKMIFVAVAVFTTAILLSGIFFNYYTIPDLNQTCRPATHIGMASDVNRTRTQAIQLTDSLTTNH